jgi:hypothetical protein
MIQASDYFRQFKDHKEITDQIKKNADKLIARVGVLLSLIPIEKPVITSGFRPQSYNKKIGGSPNSHHCFGNAIDIWDPDKKISEWCLHNIEYLKENSIFIENPEVTCKSEDRMRRWVHFQQVAPKSGNQVFNP